MQWWSNYNAAPHNNNNTIEIWFVEYVINKYNQYIDITSVSAVWEINIQ